MTNTLIALSTAIVIGLLGASVAQASNENDGGNETGGYVSPLTFISILTRARPSAAGCAGDRCRRFSFWRIPEPAGAGDGPRAAGASGQTYGVAT